MIICVCQTFAQRELANDGGLVMDGLPGEGGE